MTTTDTLPSIRTLPLGLRRFHSFTSARSEIEQTDSVIVYDHGKAVNTPWSSVLPRYDETCLTITYTPSNRQLHVMVGARDAKDTKTVSVKVMGNAQDVQVPIWTHFQEFTYDLHGDLPAGTKKFLVSII